MTTIAFDGKMLAADGQVTDDEKQYITTLHSKKIFKYKKIIWALRGDPQYETIFERWLKAGRRHDQKPRISPDACFEVLLIENGRAVTYSNEFEPVDAPVPVAIGNGRMAALAAMMAGANARKAVQIAARLDIYTGGPISVVTV